MQEQEAKGTLTLSHPRLNDLVCLLMDLDENGCCARISFQRLPAEHAVVWKRLLLPNLQLTLTVDVPNKIKFQSHGMLERAKEFYIYCDYYFHLTLEPEQRAEILRAIGHSPRKSSIALPVVPLVKPRPGTKSINVPPRGGPATLPAGKGADSPNVILKRRKLGEILAHMGHLTSDQAEQAANDARAANERLGRFLIKNNMVSARTICHALALQSGLPMVDLSTTNIKNSLATLFPYAVLKENNCVPFDATKTSVSLAIALPLTPKALRELNHACGRSVETFMAEEDLIAKYLDQIFRGRKPRKFTRYDCDIPVRYQFCGRLGNPLDETVHCDTAINISQGGLAFYCAPTIPEAIAEMRRADVYINLLLNPDNDQIHAVYQMRWIRRKGNEPMVIGGELVELAPDDQERLKNICMQVAQAGGTQ